jgi:spore coat protein H
MKKILYIIVLPIFFLFSCEENSVQQENNSDETLPSLEIFIDEDSYLNLLSNKIVDFEMGCRFSYKDQLYSGIISTSGAGSKYADKWGYKIELTDGQFVEGLSEFNLSSQIYDNSALHTVLTSYLYKQAGFPVFYSRHVFVKINNEDKGLYPLIEKIEEPFFDSRNLSVAELFKVGFDAKFSFEGTNNVQYFFEKKIPDDENFNSLIEFIHARDTSNVSTIYSSLGKFLDIENYLKYHAITSLINNVDAFTNNFLIWKEFPNSAFKIIPWDFDKAFTGSTSGKLAGYNQIVTKLFQNKEMLNEYKRLLVFYNETLLTETNLFPIIDSTTAAIKEAYEKDPNYGLMGRDFDYEIQQLKNYISERHKFIEENVEAYNGF